MKNKFVLFYSPFLLLFVACAHPKSIKTQSYGQNYSGSALTLASKEQIFKNFLLPKKNEKNIIYLMIAQEINNNGYFLLNESQKLDLQLTNRNNIFHQLLATEIHIRNLMIKNPNLMRSVLYVGQSVNLLERAKAHRREILDKTKQLQSSKVRWLSQVLHERPVELSYLLKNIPKEHLNIFECLVGHLFSVLEFKGSSQLGDTKAWQSLNRYLSCPHRLAKLKSLGLLEQMEIDRARLRELILPFAQPWSFLINGQKKSSFI